MLPSGNKGEKQPELQIHVSHYLSTHIVITSYIFPMENSVVEEQEMIVQDSLMQRLSNKFIMFLNINSFWFCASSESTYVLARGFLTLIAIP